MSKWHPNLRVTDFRCSNSRDGSCKAREFGHGCAECGAPAVCHGSVLDANWHRWPGATDWGPPFCNECAEMYEAVMKLPALVLGRTEDP